MAQAPPIRVPFPQKVKVRGKDAQAFAVEFSGEGDKETRRYFVGLPDSQPTWVSSDAISLPTSAPESDTTSAAVAAPATSGGTPPPGNGSPPTS